MNTPVFMPTMSIDGFAMDAAPEELRSVECLAAQGIGFNQDALNDAMDSAAGVTDPGVNAPWFYLNYMAKKPIQVVTQRTSADEILGRTTEASWAHVSVTRTFRELTGRTGLYKDFADSTAPRVSRGYTRESRDIIRLTSGLIIGELENRQSALVPGMYSPHQDKREAIALMMKLDRDAIAFFGYQIGDAKCYGLLNDPNLGAFETVPTIDSNVTEWKDKDAFAIIRDLQFAAATVQKRCKGNFRPSSDAFKLVLPTGCEQYLGKITECGGYSVRKWIADNWKKCEVIDTPVFDNALGGQNVFYIVVTKIGVSPCAEQIVPASLFMVGSMKRETGHSELWSMATAGTFVEQPIGIARFAGI